MIHKSHLTDSTMQAVPLNQDISASCDLDLDDGYDSDTTVYDDSITPIPLEDWPEDDDRIHVLAAAQGPRIRRPGQPDGIFLSIEDCGSRPHIHFDPKLGRVRVLTPNCWHKKMNAIQNQAARRIQEELEASREPEPIITAQSEPEETNLYSELSDMNVYSELDELNTYSKEGGIDAYQEHDEMNALASFLSGGTFASESDFENQLRLIPEDVLMLNFVENLMDLDTSEGQNDDDLWDEYINYPPDPI